MRELSRRGEPGVHEAEDIGGDHAAILYAILKLSVVQGPTPPVFSLAIQAFADTVARSAPVTLTVTTDDDF